MQWVTCKVSDPEGCHVNFARDPLHSYFHEPQKNEIHLDIYTLFIHRFSFFFNFDLNLANRRRRNYNPTFLVITFNTRHYDMTSIECYIDQLTIAFIYDVAYM